MEVRALDDLMASVLRHHEMLCADEDALGPDGSDRIEANSRRRRVEDSNCIISGLVMAKVFLEETTGESP